MRQAEQLRTAGRWAESASVLAPVVKSNPHNIPAAYYYAMALLESGQPASAAPYFKRMVATGKHLAEAHYMLARCHMEQSDSRAARKAFQKSHDLKPTALTLRSLSNLDWMEGTLEAFADRLNSVPLNLQIQAYGLWIESEDLQQAEAAWTRLDPRLKAEPGALILRSQHLRKLGDGAGTLAAARQAEAKLPGDAAVLDSVAVGAMMCGDGPAALGAIEPLRRADPFNQHWIAHEATALRLMGDQRYERLVDVESHVRAYQLPVSDGYGTIESVNDALLGALEEHHKFSNHPLDQSLRGGSQTAEDLLVMKNHVVEDYIAALEIPIRQYMADIGHDPDHPLTRRNAGTFRIKGCWSVRLRGGGKHVSHVHPDGWISSAYYVSVPPGDGTKAGWIKFGEPPFETKPHLGPEKWVQPKAGMLVLFPSYLWHGTEPIGPDAVRVTAPFDVVPN